jgi:rhodanese-related sulfurtransferase
MSTTSTPLTIDARLLHEMQESGRAPRLIDVRTPAEFETAHIPGSYNVPLDLLREHRGEFAEHLEDVVLVCRSGQRASTAEQTLRSQGLDNVHILQGGITAWQAAGLEVRHGTEKWELERQVRLVAGSLVLAGILSSVAVPKLKWLSAGIGAGLATAAVTNTCAMGMLLARLPYNRGPRCDADAIVRQLVDSRARSRSA